MNIWEIIDRAQSGQKVTEKEFDFQIFNKATELIKKYDIRHDGSSYLPLDNDVADRVFNAGVDLLSDVGTYCLGPNRIIRFTKKEILNALEDAPKEVVLGQGTDERIIRHRDVEDPNPPKLWGITHAPFYEGTPTIKIAQSIAQMPFVDMLGAGNLLSVQGRTISCLPQEVHASRRVLSWYREGAERAHRPGLALVYYPISTNPATMISALLALRKSDAIMVSPLPELRVEMGMLATAVASLDHGCLRLCNSTSVLHGFAGGPEGTAIVGVASCMLPILVFKAHMIQWHITPISSKYWWSQKGQWADAATIQALANNSHIIISGTTATSVAQPCTKMAFYEIAARVLLHVPSGSSFILAYRPFRVPRENLVTPLEIAFAHDVLLASMKYSREEAMEMAVQCVSKFEDMVGNPPEGKSFLEAYDLHTLEPKKDTLKVYDEVKEELREIGLDL